MRERERESWGGGKRGGRGVEACILRKHGEEEEEEGLFYNFVWEFLLGIGEGK